MLVDPSPKFHTYVLTLPVDAFEKPTFSGALPDAGVAEKAATGAADAALTVTKLVAVLVFVPPGPVTVKLTE